jgi:hypothetical protein
MVGTKSTREELMARLDLRVHLYTHDNLPVWPSMVVDKSSLSMEKRISASTKREARIQHNRPRKHDGTSNLNTCQRSCES